MIAPQTCLDATFTVFGSITKEVGSVHIMFMSPSKLSFIIYI